jgi:hypothetical protein
MSATGYRSPRITGLPWQTSGSEVIRSRRDTPRVYAHLAATQPSLVGVAAGRPRSAASKGSLAERVVEPDGPGFETAVGQEFVGESL